jgi:Fe-S cluster biogenesis protein NfuA
MFIQTEPTPNPATMKFLPGDTVLASGTANFTDAEMARRSPLAERLFLIDGISGVFLGSDFVTVTKTDAAEWQLLKPSVLGVIMEHYVAGVPMLISDGGDADAAAGGDFDEADAEVVDQIKELLDTRVRPAVAQDGGDIIFHGFENGIVLLEMHGACAGCPSSTATLKGGIENMLRHYVPEVLEVRAVY